MFTLLDALHTRSVNRICLWRSCSHLFQVLSGQQPYCNIRSDHQVVVAILRGVKPKRPGVPAIEDHHWDFIEQCWVELPRRPPIAEVRDLMYQFRDAVY